MNNVEVTNNVDKQYFELVNEVLTNGVIKKDRTGTGTKSIFDYTMKFNMSEGFPLLTSKKMYLRGVIVELLWFLKGDTNIKYLIDNDCHIWDGDAYKSFQKKRLKMMDLKLDESDKIKLKINDWYEEIDDKEKYIDKIKIDANFAKENANLGPVYGKQWRNWEVPIVCDIEGWFENPIDQIQNLINDLKTNPDSRRLMVSAWNVGELDQMVLPPCHYGFQCYTREMGLEERVKEWCKFHKKHSSFGEDITHEFLDSQEYPKRKLSLKWTQRSVDVGLGLSFNIASYSLLLLLLSKEVNMIPETLIFSGGDCHIYLNHIDQLKYQLKQETFDLPKLELSNISIDNAKYEDFKLIGYKSSPSIKMPLSN